MTRRGLSKERVAWRAYKAAEVARHEAERLLAERHSDEREMRAAFAKLEERRARREWIKAAEARSIAEAEAA